MKINDLRSAVTRAQGGAWVKDIALGEGEGVKGFTINVKARSINNVDYVRLRGELIRALPPDRLSEDEGARIIAESIVGALFVDWSLDEACTVDLLTEPKIGALLSDAVLRAAGIVAERGVEALEADVKN